MSQTTKSSRSGLKRGISFALCMGLVFSNLSPLRVQAEGDNAQQRAGSRVAYSGYERDQALEVNGEPFFYNGVQIRIDKVVDLYDYNDDQVKNLFKVAKDDGFTVANVQMRWTDIQPDTEILPKEVATVSEKAPNAVQNENLKVGGNSEDDENLTYLKYDMSELPDTVEAAKLRVYLPDAPNNLTQEHVMSAYDVTDECKKNSFSEMTWNNAPAADRQGLTSAKTATWDAVKKSNYYDIDVTELINDQPTNGKEITFMVDASAKKDGKTTETIVIDRNEHKPELIVSENKDQYDWSYLDKIIGYAEEYDLKLELLWFGTDTCSISADNRVPFYVYHNYQPSMADKDTPFLSKQTGGMAKAYGVYWYLMCKNDKKLQEQEGSAINAMFDHVAVYNAVNQKNTVIGCQVANEPNVSKLHGGSVKNLNGNKVPHCMCDNCLNLKKSMGLGDQGFRDWTMFEYCNSLAKAVKTSDYPVWTRVNNVQGNDAWGVSYNEKMRANGGTDTDRGTYLDFIGLDPYGWGRSGLYGFGKGDYSQGENLPMVMESGGEKSMSALMALATIAGGAYYNVYDLCSPDGHALYNKDGSPNKIGAGDKYLPNGGTYIEDVRSHNHLLNKIAYELATKKPDSIGGTDLRFFNCEGTEKSSINVKKQIEGVDITYQSDTLYSSGIAVKRSQKEIVLESTKDDNATFTLSGLVSSGIESVEFGHYEGTDWVKDEGEVGYRVIGKDVVVTMPSFSCVRVKTAADMPAPAVYEAEALDKQGVCTVNPSSVKKDNFDDAAAHGGGWLKFSNLTEGTKISFEVDVLEDTSNARIVTGYKAGSDRGTMQLSINGVNYGTPIDMRQGSGYTSVAPSDVAVLKAGQKNTFTYTVTRSAAQVSVDYIGLIKQEAMPGTIEGYTLIDENFDNISDNFGFGKGTSVSDSALNLTHEMGNYTTSVKNFDANVTGQSAVDLSFDWKSKVTSGGKKTGIEFRDLYGRLIFALSGAKGGSELRYSTMGWDSDSSHSKWEWEPTWSSVGMDTAKTYTIRLLADFEQKTVSFSIAEKDGNIVVQELDVPTDASGLAKMAACNYYTEGATGTQTIDNFKLIAKQERLDLPFEGKSVYAFGDSIVDGHKYANAGFVEFVSAKEGMVLKHNGAVNGATIMPGGTGGQILDQINSAPGEAPDFVIFDGGTDDAYESNDSLWGSVGESKDPAQFDVNTVAGNFESMIYEIQQKWPDARLIYVAAHKLNGGRAVERQDILHELEMSACNKWGVTVANLYDDSEFNTREQDYRWNYTFDELGTDGLPGNMNTIMSSDFDADHPSGIYPNFRGIENFYVPMLSHAFRTEPEDPKADKSALQALYDENKEKEGSGYTEESWSDFKAVLEAAKAVLEKEDAVQKDINEALQELRSAVNALVKVKLTDKSGLETMVSVIEGLNPEDYSAATWDVLISKLNLAKEVLENVKTTQDTVDTVYGELVKAWTGLENALNTSAAQPMIEQAEAVLEDTEKYRPTDVEAIMAALQPVKDAIMSEQTTQEELNNLTMALCEALINLKEQVDAGSLRKVADQAASLLEKKDLYTATMAAALETALNDTIAVLEDENRTQDQVSTAYQSLTTAIAGLQKRGDKTVMEPLLEKAGAILAEASKYGTASIEGLQEALEAATAVYDNPDALQQEINLAAAKLSTELSEVRILGDVDGNGQIDTSDAVEVLKTNAELVELDEAAADAADVNRDGTIDTKDATEIQKYAAEVIAGF